MPTQTLDAQALNTRGLCLEEINCALNDKKIRDELRVANSWSDAELDQHKQLLIDSFVETGRAASFWKEVKQWEG